MVPLQLSEIDIISWDVDGTLYSSRQMISRMLMLSAKKMVTSNPFKVLHEHYMLHSVRRDIKRIRKRKGEVSSIGFGSNLQVRLPVEEYWYGEAIAYAGLQAGVKKCIDEFAAAGLRQIVVSDYEARYKLRILGIENVFHGIYAGETIGYIKPSRLLFAKVALDLGVNPGRILHIGNHEHLDGIAAREAGCHAAILGKDFKSFYGLLESIEGKHPR